MKMIYVYRHNIESPPSCLTPISSASSQFKTLTDIKIVLKLSRLERDKRHHFNHNFVS